MKPPIRVAHVLYSFHTGGMEKGVATLASHASPDLDHAIVCMGRSGAASRLLPQTTRVIELDKPPGHSLRFVSKLAGCLRMLAPDVVHTRNWGGMDGVVAARLAGIRKVVHGEHGWGMGDPFGADSKRILTRRILAMGVREFTCVSKAMIGWLRDSVKIRKPITQIYNGVDTDVYRPGPPASSVREDLGLTEGSLVLGTVGRLDPIKDHPSLFRAFAELRPVFPDLTLLVVGNGPEYDRLRQLSGPGIRVLGDRHDVRDLLRLIDVFVLSSINEGISNTILEAMAAGRPIVATRVGGNPELVCDGETGRLVQPKDPSALAAAVAEYLSSPDLRRRHGHAAREAALGRFSIPAMVASYEGIYRRLATRRSAVSSHLRA